MSHGWSLERRKKQAELIRNWRPWNSARGPTTYWGKEISKMNALKHGQYSAEERATRNAMRTQLKLAKNNLNSINERFGLS